MEFKLFGKHIAGTPSPPKQLKPDRYALSAYKQGLTVYTKSLPAGILKPDVAISRIELAGWVLQHREDVQRASGARVVLTFRRTGP
ncbi:hypothetical protein [Streptomyces sp. NPDC002346]